MSTLNICMIYNRCLDLYFLKIKKHTIFIILENYNMEFDKANINNYTLEELHDKAEKINNELK